MFREILKRVKALKLKKKADEALLEHGFLRDTEVMLFFLNKAPTKRLSVIRMVELVYLADIYHIKKYGTPITTFTYIIFKKNHEEAKGQLYRRYSEQIATYFDGFLYAKREFDAKKGNFVASEIQTMEYIWNTFGHLKDEQMSLIEHCYPSGLIEIFAEPDEKAMESIHLLGFDSDPLKVDPKILNLSKKIFIKWLQSDGEI